MLAGPSPQLSGLAFAVVVLIASTALVAALAWASCRLLGLPVGILRALIAGALGSAVAVLLGRSLRAAQPGHEAAFFTVVLGVPLIVAMVFIVLAEVLVPSGSMPRPVEVARGIRPALARSRRYAHGWSGPWGNSWRGTSPAVRLFADERDRRVVTGLTHLSLLALLGAASGIVAAMMLGTPGGPQVTTAVSLSQVIGYNLLIAAGVLGLRVLFTIFRSR